MKHILLEKSQALAFKNKFFSFIHVTSQSGFHLSVIQLLLGHQPSHDTVMTQILLLVVTTYPYIILVPLALVT